MTLTYKLDLNSTDMNQPSMPKVYDQLTDSQLTGAPAQLADRKSTCQWDNSHTPLTDADFCGFLCRELAYWQVGLIPCQMSRLEVVWFRSCMYV